MQPATRARIQEAQSRFSKEWRAFGAARKVRPEELPAAAFSIIRGYERALGDLYRVRAQLPPTDPFRQRTEDTLADLSHEIATLADPKSARAGYRAWVAEYRRIWRANLALFLFTAVLFLCGLVVGWHLAVSHGDLITVLVPQSMLEQILEKQKWFEQLQTNPLLGGLAIAFNNIKVCILCFVAGAFLGLGGMVLMTYNGVLFGAVMGYCYVNHFDDALTNFVVGHGPLELTIIVASTFASFLFGRVFYMRPTSLFRTRLTLAGQEAGVLLTGILPWLVLAATLEAFVSPFPFEIAYKIAAGLVAASAFWLWTFWPSTSNSDNLNLKT